MLSAEEVGTYYSCNPFKVPGLWDLSKKHFRVSPFDGRFVKLNRFERACAGINVMSNECLRKDCAICGKRITGANYHCPNCKLCLCFMCGLKIILAEHDVRPTCPSCGNKLT